VTTLVRRRVRRETVLIPGQGLFGRGTYGVRELIGAGAFALVYRGEDAAGRGVAIKEYRTPVNPRERQVVKRMWRRESETLAALPAHRAMTRFIEAFTLEGRDYVIQEFVEGESLADILARRGAVAEHEAIGWGRQMCEALVYLHEHGVVHHDLKPENVIVNPEGRVVLLDLGSAQFLGRDAADVAGSAGYLAPEIQQLAKRRGLQPQPGTDVFALGCVLYEMLLGKRPSQEHIDGLSVRLVGPLLRGLSRFDPGLVKVMVHAISYDADYRFQSAREMLEGFLAWAPAVPQAQPAKLDLGVLKGHEHHKVALRVTNAGGGALEAEARTSAPWLRIGLSGRQEEEAVSIAGNDTALTVTALADAIPPGQPTVSAQIEIASALATLVVPCTGQVAPEGARVQTYYPAVFLRARRGQRAHGIIAVRNAGDQAGQFTCRHREAHPLQLDPETFTLRPMEALTVAVAVDTAALRPGGHMFPVSITAEGGHHAEVEVHVDVYAGPVRRLLHK